MADIVSGTVAYLLTNTALTAIVGTRVMPIPAPEDLSDYPCVTYQVASEANGYTLEGPDGVPTIRIVFECYGALYSNARSAALAIKSALSGYTGTLPDGTVVFETEIATIQDGFDDGSRISRTSVHVKLTYSG